MVSICSQMIPQCDVLLYRFSIDLISSFLSLLLSLPVSLSLYLNLLYVCVCYIVGRSLEALKKTDDNVLHLLHGVCACLCAR